MSSLSTNPPNITGITPLSSFQYSDEDRVGVSVVIPVYNEEESLDPLVRELLPVLEGLGETFEVVFVDDGSRDRSLQIMQGMVERDSRIRVVQLSGNFGQQWANTAGLRFARGRAVVLMDADLQQPPQYIPALLGKLREGYELVLGRRIVNRGPLYRRLGSKFAGSMIRRLTGLAISDTSSNYIAMHSDLVARVNQYNDHTRHLASIIARLSFGRCGEVNVEKRDRMYGTSKYSLPMLVRMTLNLIYSLSLAPLNIPHYLGGGGAGSIGIGHRVGAQRQRDIGDGGGAVCVAGRRDTVLWGRAIGDAGHLGRVSWARVYGSAATASVHCAEGVGTPEPGRVTKTANGDVRPPGAILLGLLYGPKKAAGTPPLPRLTLPIAVRHYEIAELAHQTGGSPPTKSRCVGYQRSRTAPQVRPAPNPANMRMSPS